VSGKRGQAGRMTKLTHAEREIRRQRNDRRQREKKLRRKFKIPTEEPMNRVLREMRR
jgi:hypothetical protein